MSHPAFFSFEQVQETFKSLAHAFISNEIWKKKFFNVEKGDKQPN